MNNDQWTLIAANYEQERESVHTACFTIDDLLRERIRIHPSPGRILDYGAGSGKLSRQIYDGRADIVAYEPMAAMFDVLLRLTPTSNYPKLTAISDPVALKSGGLTYDIILCVNVFDHIEDIPDVLTFFKKHLNPNGLLLLSIPHPMKNIGSWVKHFEEGSWKYDFYRLDGYLNECVVTRTREDVNGNIVVPEVKSFHRKLSTYFNWLIDAGFSVDRLHEPGIASGLEHLSPALQQQLSRIPYFLIIECFHRSP